MSRTMKAKAAYQARIMEPAAHQLKLELQQEGWNGSFRGKWDRILDVLRKRYIMRVGAPASDLRFRQLLKEYARENNLYIRTKGTREDTLYV